MRHLQVFLALALLLSANAARAFDHTHGAWTALLKKHVRISEGQSKVDYVGFKRDLNGLGGYLHLLSNVTKPEFAAFTREQKMAFLINAYNAFTVKIVVQHYPLKSIKDIGSLFKNTWKIKFIKLFADEMSLDEIEQEYLRKDYKEPRVHFALNCGALGCPALRAEAYTPEQLNAQLDDQIIYIIFARQFAQPGQSANHEA